MSDPVFAQMMTSALVMVPVAAGSVPNGAMFMDKDQGNALVSKSASGQPSRMSYTVKLWQNKSGVTIPKGKPVAKMSNGSVIRGDSDEPTAETILAVALEDVADQAIGSFSLIGPNVEGAIADLGFVPGQPVYFDASGGYTNDASTLNPATNAIIRVGYADCAEGEASAVATDLIMFAEVISRP